MTPSESSPPSGRVQEGRWDYVIYAAAILILVTMPVLWLVRAEINEYRNISRTFESLTLLEATFLAYEAVSAERGPSNGLLAVGASDEYRTRSESLKRARATTDARLANLVGALEASHCDNCQAIKLGLKCVRHKLAKGRAAFDALYADPQQQKRPGAVGDAVEAMFEAAAPFSVMLNNATSIEAVDDPALTNLLLLSRLAAEFREFAGRFGSFFSESLVTGRGFRTEDLRAAVVIQGRIYQIRDFLLARVGDAQKPPALQRAVERLKREYLNGSLKMAENTLDSQLLGGSVALTPGQFADQYVPGMASILAVRDAAFTEARERVAARRHSVMVKTVAAIGIGMLFELGAVFLVFRLRGRYVLRLADLTNALSAVHAERKRAIVDRDEILSELSHDIKSPQAGILALLELARTTDAYRSNPDLFLRIDGYARRTLKMVDDFMKISQSQFVFFDPVPIDLHGAVLDSCENLYATAARKSIALDVEDTDGEPYIVYGDPDLLLRAITNVIDNAIKYSPANTAITVRLERDGRCIVLSIKDRGYGIAAQNVRHVFSRYRRFSAPGQPPVGGTGLGLSFVKDVVVRMRGKVSCQSSLGVGTEFVLRFPKKRSSTRRLRFTGGRPLQRYRASSS